MAFRMLTAAATVLVIATASASDGPVVLAEMNTVGAEPPGERNAVVHDESDTGIGANPLQRFGKAREVVLAHILDA